MTLPTLTFTRTDRSTFTLQPTLPRSFAARQDVLEEYAQARDSGRHNKLMRAITAAVGLCLVGQRPPEQPEAAAMPRYADDGELMRYASQVTNVLMAGIAGWNVVPNEAFYEGAHRLVNHIAESMPRTEVIEARTDFTEASGGDSTTPPA